MRQLAQKLSLGLADWQRHTFETFYACQTYSSKQTQSIISVQLWASKLYISDKNRFRKLKTDIKKLWPSKFVNDPQTRGHQNFKIAELLNSINHLNLKLFIFMGLLPLSKPGSIFQILTCLIWALWVHVTYLFTDSIIKSCDSPDWSVQTCYQSASSHVTGNHFLTQKCFSEENLIIVLLNTVIPIFVIV